MRFLYFDLLMISSSSTFFVRRVSLKYELSNVFQNLIPSLDHQSIKYKGQNGRILVIGGSRDYTGAPYYSGQSALKYGADLATILCSKDASLPIKSYSPELMVTPLYDDEKIYDNMTNEKEIKTSIRLLEERLPRAHSVVIGPGLGRAPIAPIISKAISLAIENNIP